MLKFEFATIEYSAYYGGYLVWIYTAAYQAGELWGISDLGRMEHAHLIQDFAGPYVWLTIEEAVTWANGRGYYVAQSKTVYHVTDGILHIPTQADGA